MPVTVARLNNNKYLILDGHHRAIAFKELGIKRIPAVVFKSYFTSKIKVLSWYILTDQLSKDVFQMAEKIIYNKRRGITEVYIKEKYREEVVDKIKVKRFIASDEYEKIDGKQDYRYIIIRTPFSKKEIVKRALQGKLFPPKSTRHKYEIGMEMINYYIPITSLNEDMT